MQATAIIAVSLEPVFGRTTAAGITAAESTFPYIAYSSLPLSLDIPGLLLFECDGRTSIITEVIIHLYDNL